MAVGLLDLPVEIRLKIYTHVFGTGKAIFETESQTDPPTFVPAESSKNSLPRSAQLLRTCKTVLVEAEPTLYNNTEFYSFTEAFAGKLPTQVSNGGALALKVRQLTWQLRCDMMKRFYPEDLNIEAGDVFQLNHLELRCQADNWRDASCGIWCDKDSFEQSHKEIVDYARGLRNRMDQNDRGKVYLTEDRSQLRRGRIILLMRRRPPVLTNNIFLIDD